MANRQVPAKNKSQAKRRRGRVRYSISPMGWVLLVIALAIAVAAMRRGEAMLFIIFGVLIGAEVASVAMSGQMVRAVQLRRDVSDRAWQNQTVHVAYFLRNVRRRSSCLGISVEEIAPQGIQSASGYCVHLPPRQVFRAGARFVSRRRGRISLRRYRISTSFPFGLIRAHRIVEQEASIVIWPAKGRLKRQVLTRGAVQTSSAAPSPVSGGQDEFFGLREYRSDDNPRWIHWRKSAGKGAPVVREMARPLPETLWIIMDTFCHDASQPALARREATIRFAATFIEHALAKDYEVGLALAIAGHVAVMPPGKGLGHRCQLLDALTDIDVNKSVPLSQVLHAVRPKALLMSQVTVICQAPTKADQGMLRGLKGRCRYLDVVDREGIARVFVDDPLATEGADAS